MFGTTASTSTRLRSILVCAAFIATSCGSHHLARDTDAGSLADTAAADATAGDPADEPYQISLATGQPDPAGNILGGTELINLVAYHATDGSPLLYAGNGYWEDTAPDSSTAPQVLVLDSPHDAWRQDHAFAETTSDGENRFGRLTALGVLTFTTDGVGAVLPLPATLLVAGFERNGVEGSGGVFSRDDQTGAWTEIPTTAAADLSFRSIHVHHDRVTGIDHVFAGAGRGTGGTPGAIFIGVYDPTAAGSIRFEPTPEFTGFENRVMAFEDANGALFFEAKPDIYERTDGALPWWTSVYTDPRVPLVANNSGGRGLTAVTDPLGSGNQVLLTGLEGIGSTIIRLDPIANTLTTELDLDATLTDDWGPLDIPYVIPSYNDMALATDPDTGASLRLIGLQAHDPNAGEERSAWFLVRQHADQSYGLHEIAPLTTTIPRGLVAVRTMVVSPFLEDAGRVMYVGGFDADYVASHDSAWLYRVGLRTALSN